MTELSEKNSAVRELLFRNEQFLEVQAQQSAACNISHGVTERLAKWILLVHEETGANELSMTQEYIAELIGVRRPTVSVVHLSFRRAD